MSNNSRLSTLAALSLSASGAVGVMNSSAQGQDFPSSEQVQSRTGYLIYMPAQDAGGAGMAYAVLGRDNGHIFRIPGLAQAALDQEVAEVNSGKYDNFEPGFFGQLAAVNAAAFDVEQVTAFSEVVSVRDYLANVAAHPSAMTPFYRFNASEAELVEGRLSNLHSMRAATDDAEEQIELAYELSDKVNIAGGPIMMAELSRMSNVQTAAVPAADAAPIIEQVAKGDMQPQLSPEQVAAMFANAPANQNAPATLEDGTVMANAPAASTAPVLAQAAPETVRPAMIDGVVMVNAIPAVSSPAAPATIEAVATARPAMIDGVVMVNAVPASPVTAAVNQHLTPAAPVEDLSSALDGAVMVNAPLQPASPPAPAIEAAALPNTPAVIDGAVMVNAEPAPSPALTAEPPAPEMTSAPSEPANGFSKIEAGMAETPANEQPSPAKEAISPAAGQPQSNAEKQASPAVSSAAEQELAAVKEELTKEKAAAAAQSSKSFWTIFSVGLIAAGSLLINALQLLIARQAKRSFAADMKAMEERLREEHADAMQAQEQRLLQRIEKKNSLAEQETKVYADKSPKPDNTEGDISVFMNDDDNAAGASATGFDTDAESLMELTMGKDEDDGCSPTPASAPVSADMDVAAALQDARNRSASSQSPIDFGGDPAQKTRDDAVVNSFKSRLPKVGAASPAIGLSASLGAVLMAGSPARAEAPIPVPAMVAVENIFTASVNDNGIATLSDGSVITGLYVNSLVRAR
ncbi:MAG: hypothetical protein AB7G80_03220 [Dongiaceae bacterium]